jgi:hypothetical protein
LRSGGTAGVNQLAHGFLHVKQRRGITRGVVFFRRRKFMLCSEDEGYDLSPDKPELLS